MTASERWDRVKTLFHQSLDRPKDDRSAFLREACGADATLSADVQSLLDAHERADHSLRLASPFDALDRAAVGSLVQVLQPGDRLGPYDILLPLGFGGMGEVYKARDTRLNRIVAIKVLSTSVGDDESRARFTREAQAVAALNHPHICTLYDVGCSTLPNRPEPVDFLVMEFVEGETLAARLARGALRLDHALAIAIQIGDALVVAHRSGIVHRDLKPGNVMLLTSGGLTPRLPEAKLLDFGLAKVITRTTDAVEATSTIPTNLTGPHVVLGTLPYMAPEQLDGAAADARSDVFAFGVLLYEMVCGRPPFAGSNETILVGEVTHADPRPVHELQPAAPLLLSHVVERCLAKRPEQRWQSISDVVADLRWIVTTRATPDVATRTGVKWLRSAAAVGLLMAAAALITWFVSRTVADPALTARFAIAPSDGRILVQDEAPVVSPDGRQIAFVAGTEVRRGQLHVRSIDDLASRVLPGTEGARSPFWSPDSTWIGFFADNQLKRIAAAGGSVQTLSPGTWDHYGGSWSPNGTIIFAPSEESGLYRVSAAGGAAVPLTTVDMAQSEHGHYWPHFLPDGNHFLFTVDSSAPDQDGLYVGALNSADRRLLVPGLSNASYVNPGYLLFTRDRTLLTQRFDADELRLIGQPIVVAEGVTLELCCGTRLLYSASLNGVLAYRTDDQGDLTQMTWFNRDGTQAGSVGPPGRWRHPDLSPDETTVAVTLRDSRSGDDIWLFDVSRNTGIRFTSEPSWDLSPIWSPDGNQVVFSSDRLGPYNLFTKRISEDNPGEVLFKSPARMFPMHWSADGRWLIYQAADTKTDLDLWAWSFADGTRKLLRQSPYGDADGSLSPDMRWLAYMSEESGQPEIYVQGFPDATPRRRISTNGGRQPSWRRDGKEISFLADGAMMAVEIKETGGPLEFSTPKRLFPIATFDDQYAHNYRMTADGQRFLVALKVEPRSAQPLITVVVNWVGTLNGSPD